jgi:hypothetical protein
MHENVEAPPLMHLICIQTIKTWLARGSSNKQEKHKTKTRTTKPGTQQCHPKATTSTSKHEHDNSKTTQFHFFMVLNVLGTETTGVLSPTSPMGSKNFPINVM